MDLKIQERDIAKVVKNMQCTAMPEAYERCTVPGKMHSKGYKGFVLGASCRRATAVRERFRCTSSSTFPRAKRAFIWRAGYECDCGEFFKGAVK